MAAGGVCFLKGYYMKLDFSILIEYIPLFKSGLLITLKFTVLSLVVGFVLGFVLALIKVSKSKWLVPLRWFADFYTSVFRGTPQLVQLFIIYYATPQLFNYIIPEIQAAVICFGLNSAAYISETLKGGILGIDKGQFEASKALGISYIRTMAFIILPQALKITLPALVNESISLLKGSSLVSKRICEKRGLTFYKEKISEIPPIDMSQEMQEKLSKVAKSLKIPHRIMMSGAGHDAMSFAQICDTALLFIPCDKGVSHNKHEFATIESICDGAIVMFEYLKGESV